MENKSTHKAVVLSGPQVIILPDEQRYVVVVAQITPNDPDPDYKSIIDAVVIPSEGATRIPGIGEEITVTYYVDFLRRNKHPGEMYNWFCWCHWKFPKEREP